MATAVKAHALKGKRTSMAIVKNDAKPPAASFSKSFVATAKKHDAELRETWSHIQRDFVKIGKIALTMKRKAEHVALGYKNFDDYIREAVSDKGRTQVLEAVRIVRILTTGTSAIPEADVSKMTRENAKQLITLRERGVKITPKIIEAAKQLPAARMQEEIVLPKLRESGKSTPDEREREREPWASLNITTPREIMKNLVHAHEIMKYVARDDDRKISLDAKAWDMMAAEIVATYGADYDEWRQREAQEAERVAEEESKKAEKAATTA